MILSLVTIITVLSTVHGGIDNLPLNDARYLLNLGRDFTDLFGRTRTPPQFATLTLNRAGLSTNFDPCDLSFADRPLTEHQNYVARIRITARDPGGPRHSERQVLDQLNALMTRNRPVSYVHIYTLNSPCRGCANTIASVARANPGVQFYIGYSQLFVPYGEPASAGQDILQHARRVFRSIPNVHFAQLDPSCLVPDASDTHDELRKKRSFWWPWSGERQCRIIDRRTEGTCMFRADATGAFPFVRFGRLHHSSGKCVHPYRGSHDPGQDTRIVFHDCNTDSIHGYARINWGITPTGRIVHISSGKCLHPLGGATFPSDDTNVVLHTDNCWPDLNNRRNITWEQTPSGSVQHRTGLKCWHPYRGTAYQDTPVVVHTGCDENRLKFNFVFHSSLPAFVAYGRIQHSGGYCVHPKGGAYNPSCDTKLVLHHCSTTYDRNYARITFGLTSRGHIIHVSSGRCVHVKGGLSNPSEDRGIVLHEHGCWGSDRSDIQWDLTSGKSIAQLTSGKCWHPYRGATNPGLDTEIVVHSGCNADRLNFIFI